MTNNARGLACDIKILNEIERQFQYAEATKSKSYFMRYDVRLPEALDHTDNGLFREFQSKYIKNRSRKGFKPQYVAVREQSKEKHQHYHVALWLDGQKTQNIHDHITTAERLWNKTLGLPDRENGYGLIDDCTKSRSMVLCCEEMIRSIIPRKMIASEERHIWQKSTPKAMPQKVRESYSHQGYRNNDIFRKDVKVR